MLGIRYYIAMGLAGAALGGLLYVNGLRDAVERLTVQRDVAQATTIQVADKAFRAEMKRKALATANATYVAALQEGRLRELTARATIQELLQRESQDNDDFKDCMAMPVPDSLNRLWDHPAAADSDN